MKTLISLAILLIGLTSFAQGIPKPALVDFNGQRTGVIGFADYKLVSSYLKNTLKGNVIPVPFNAQGTVALKADGTFDFAQAKYAAVSLIRYDANYGFTGFNQDPVNDADVVKKNPTGVLPTKKVSQFWVNHIIINPVLTNPSYKKDPKFNPDYTSFYFNNVATDDADFAAKGKALWSTQAMVSGNALLNINYNPALINETSSVAKMAMADGSNLVTLKMGVSKTKPAKTFNRSARINILASDDAEQSLYPVNATETVVMREYDPQVDSIEVGGNLKTYLDSIKFMPTTWDLGVRWSSNVGFIYDTSKN